MKNLLFTLLLQVIGFTQVSINPSTIEINQQITITVDINTTDSDCNGMNNPNKVYLHYGVGTDSDAWDTAVVGNWAQDDGVGEMSDNGDGTWSITFIPQSYYNLTEAEASTITKMGMVFRSEDGSQELKDNGCSDFFFNVSFSFLFTEFLK